MIVIDASSLAKYLLGEDNYKEVERAMKEPVYSLDIIFAEVTNAIWKAHTLKDDLSEEEALLRFETLEIARKEILRVERSESYMKGALKLAMAERIAIYDALYIVQAARYTKLLTSDEKQSRIAIKLDIETIFVK